MTDTAAVNLELVARMPWLLPEPDSIWSITGTYGRGRGRFQDCLAMVTPYDLMGCQPLFVLIAPALQESDASPTRYIAPNQIFSAHRLVLVHAERPHAGLAYYADEQDIIDRGRGER
ncbi:hypothetical protein [Nocardia sp. NPDC059228]|uniref:hypothetical protein n=1 Tax=Nocardia sp. NPDC059228 TaxID=3346777 RepID=UPI0036826B5C